MGLISLNIVLLCLSVFVCKADEKTMVDKLKEKYTGMVIECFKENPIDSEDMDQVQNKQMPDNYVAKCLFACVYKKSGMMTDDGKLSVDGVNEIAQKFFADDKEKLKMSEEITNECKSVNDEPVSDGDKGCERAALIFKCTVERAPEFDFI